MSGFASLLTSVAGPVAKRALQALGIGVISYAAVQAAFSAAQAQMLALYGQAPASMMWIVERAGFSSALGIILGAVAAKFGLAAVSKLGRLGS